MWETFVLYIYLTYFFNLEKHRNLKNIFSILDGNLTDLHKKVIYILTIDRMIGMKEF